MTGADRLRQAAPAALRDPRVLRGLGATFLVAAAGSTKAARTLNSLRDKIRRRAWDEVEEVARLVAREVADREGTP